MRPINVRTLTIVAVSATVLAGTVVPADGTELADPGVPAEVAAKKQPADGVAAEKRPATGGAAVEGQPVGDDVAVDDGAVSWKQNGKGWWFDLGDGTYAKNELTETDDVIYHFDENDYMITG